MDRTFDLRLASHRQELASHLPTFDGRTFAISTEAFMSGLADVSYFFADPEWLVYQWGMLGPIRDRKSVFHIGLERVIALGHELRDLSRYQGFQFVLKSFLNPSQFHDCLFEVQIASMFSRLAATTSVTLAPTHVVRGREKRPEFDLETIIGPLSVECKRLHPDKHGSSARLNSIVTAVKMAMDAAAWPDHLRLEIELTGPIREQASTFAKSLVERALQSEPGTRPLTIAAANAYVISRQSPFCIENMQAGHDLMVGIGQATHLFNPTITKLRIGVNDRDNKIASVVGAQIVKALKQLPEDRLGIIMLGDIPLRIATRAIERRIDSAAYDNILAFGVYDYGELHFVFRETRRPMLDQLMNSGMRPLFAT
jgi:hypothetical protein